MNHEIKVSVVEFGDRRHFQLQYRDPQTRRKITKSSGIESNGTSKARKLAEREAGVWQDELRSGRYTAPNKTTWQEFRQRYEGEALPSLSHSTAKKIATTFGLVERHINPRKLADLTAEALSRWMTQIKAGRGEATVAMYCRHLKSTLGWAADLGLVTTVPKMRIPKQPTGAKLMKGRPIVGEERERMLMAVPKVVEPADVPKWQALLDGLWWSGLRLAEALKLSWEPTADVCAVVVPGSNPVVRFRVAGQKARREEVWPCPPEFAQLLQAIPEAERTGKVFKFGLSVDHMGRVIGNIGKAAKVVVDEAKGKPATAHDYRRAFGTRWSKLVMPAVLKRLMRHKNINTTLKYYVDSEAEDIAADLWKAYNRQGNNLPNSGRQTREIPADFVG